MRKRLPLLLTLLLPLGACGDGDSDPVGPDPTGSLSFAYSGDISGTFAVSGEATLGDDRYPQNSFAAAATDAGSVLIAGFRPTQRPKFDYFQINLPGVRGPTTATLCTQPASGSSCPELYLLLGLNGLGSSTFDQAYLFVSGGVAISDVAAARVRGSFQGTAVFLNPATSAANFERTITVTNGQFDVPVRNDL